MVLVREDSTLALGKMGVLKIFGGGVAFHSTCPSPCLQGSGAK